MPDPKCKRCQGTGKAENHIPRQGEMCVQFLDCPDCMPLAMIFDESKFGKLWKL